MLCSAPYATACHHHHPMSLHPSTIFGGLDDMFDDLFASSCSMAQLKAQKAQKAHAIKAAQKARAEEAARRELLLARRAEQRKRQSIMQNKNKNKNKNIRIGYVQHSDDWVTFAMQVLEGVPKDCKISLEPAAGNALRVRMVQRRPQFRVVYDLFGNGRLVQTGSTDIVRWSETVSFQTDAPLDVGAVEALASGPNVISVMVPYARPDENQGDDDDDDEEEEIVIAASAHDMEDTKATADDTTDTKDTEEEAFEIEIDVGGGAASPEDSEMPNDDIEHVEATLAPETDEPQPLVEDEIDGSVSDCALDE